MHRFFPPALSTIARRLGVVAVSCLAVATLASCGGGTQSKKFVPESLVVFGDEFSLVQPNGAKYAINSFVSGSTPPYTCALRPIWVLYFADSLGFSFSNECTDWPAKPRVAVMLANDPQDVSINTANPIDSASITSATTAVANAGANAVLTKINNNLGLLNDTTLVTVSVGRADIVRAYQSYLASPDSATLSSLVSSLDTLGKNFSAGLRPVAQRGARIMLVLTPNLGSSPLAKADTANKDRNQAAMQALSKAFNEGVELGASIAGLTGQQVSLVRVDQIADVMAVNQATYGLTNVDASACLTPAASAPLCMGDTGSLAAADADVTYMWADPTHLNSAVRVQGTLSQLVYSAFSRNPF